jgi:hypothetical protein
MITGNSHRVFFPAQKYRRKRSHAISATHAKEAGL